MSPSQRVPVMVVQRARYEICDSVQHECDTRGGVGYDGKARPLNYLPKIMRRRNIIEESAVGNLVLVSEGVGELDEHAIGPVVDRCADEENYRAHRSTHAHNPVLRDEREVRALHESVPRAEEEGEQEDRKRDSRCSR